ncbi:MAG TPA: hypothetical protein VIQ99_07360 [Gammaproteobacteria bacterium]
MSRATLDRRKFIAGAGAAVAGVCLPVTLAVAAPAVGGASLSAALADWHIDDMWGVHPRPHEAIGYGRPRGDGELVAGVAAADLAFLNA